MALDTLRGQITSVTAIAKYFAKMAEKWARGTVDGVAVDSSDDTYHNNSKYYSELANTSRLNAAQSESNASQSASQSASYASDASAAKSDAEDAATAAAASAEAAASVFSVVGNVAFSVLANGQVREVWTEVE
jgi:hypothetical protein